MEKPATRASPEEGGNSVVSILMVVVLPAPLEPSRAKTSPALTERVTASTAVNVPKRRVRSLISRTMSLIGIISSATFQRLSPVRRPDTCGRKGSTRCHKRCKRHRSNTSLPPRIPDRDPPAGTRSRRMRSADTPYRTRGWASGTSVDCRKKDRRCSEEYSNRHNLRAATRCDAPATRPGFAIPSAVATRLPAAGYAAVAVVAVPAAVAAAVAESVGPAVAAVVERVAPAAVAVASAVAVAVGPAVAAVVGRALPAAVGVASAVAVAVGPAVAAVVERALPAAAAVASAVAVSGGAAVAAVVERAVPAAVVVASAVAVAVGPAVAAVVERALPAAAAVAFAAAVAVAVERVSPAAAPAVASQAACLVYPAARAKG